MLNIALAGPRCAGSTTIANMLVELFGYRRLSLEDAARAELAVAKAVSVQDIIDSPALYFDDLQKLYDKQRTINARYWVNLLAVALDNYTHLGRPVVVDDVRYLDEAALLEARGLMLIGVHALPSERIKRHQEKYDRTVPLRPVPGTPDNEAHQIKKSFVMYGSSRPLWNMARFLIHLDDARGTADA